MRLLMLNTPSYICLFMVSDGSARKTADSIGHTEIKYSMRYNNFCYKSTSIMLQ